MSAGVRRVYKASVGYGLGIVLAAASAFAAQPTYLTLESLLQKGWEVAGYAGTADNRSSLLLLKKAGETYLVQCSTFHDVTRTPRVSTNCYELR
jgi:hypothetical protein